MTVVYKSKSCQEVGDASFDKAAIRAIYKTATTSTAANKASAAQDFDYTGRDKT